VVRFLGQAREFSALHKVQTDPDALPDKGSLFWIKAAEASR